jgi:large subunit ribosomal protein L21
LFAILETGGKQYKVAPGTIVKVEKLQGARGDTYVFDRVLAVSTDDATKVGNPYIEGAKINGTILRQGKARKILVFKYKSKTNYRRRYGHRQPYTEVRIDSIG